MTEPVDVGVALFTANRALEQRAHRAALDAGGNLTLPQARLAARIGPDGTRLTELASRALVTKQSAAHLVRELERAGYVDQVPDPADGRAKLVRLTAAAQPLVAAGNTAVIAELAAWRSHLGSERMAQLEDALAALREITDPWV